FTVLESAILGLALNEAAYLSEILRGSILSVAKGQTEAARAIGLRPFQIFRLVVLPQALRVIIPPLGNSVNGLLKTTSIASVISMEEVLRRGQILMQQKFQVLEVFMVVAIIYLVMTTCWDFVQRHIEAYYARAYGAAADKQLARAEPSPPGRSPRAGSSCRAPPGPITAGPTAPPPTSSWRGTITNLPDRA